MLDKAQSRPDLLLLLSLVLVTGALYIAITVALLVSSYKQQGTSGDPRATPS